MHGYLEVNIDKGQETREGLKRLGLEEDWKEVVKKTGDQSKRGNTRSWRVQQGKGMGDGVKSQQKLNICENSIWKPVLCKTTKNKVLAPVFGGLVVFCKDI